ncbi:zinc finger BED domain-containing protein 5-like [Anguilla anguilla]|uniref:zinc finger BED domain-containing protein 5-like n=1 Tax=Anguilla anguilla TaxID=7936 RepID=UPI0015ADD58D|nr:zinc finger BED domain-containing protein 5-like [Anguilla anguilla]
MCLQVLANEAMMPAKLKRHLITKHLEYQGKTQEFFCQKSKEYTRQKTRMVNLVTTSERAQKASYLVAQRIAKSKKPHTIGEELILPAAVEMCEVMLGTEAANKLKAVPLSNDTGRRRIEELSVDIQSQLLDRLRSCEQFSIQLDKSTDIASAAQLIVLVRYPWEGNILEGFLFCKEVPGRTMGEEIFRLLDAFMTEAGLSWEKCVAVCMDGAAMTGRKSGVIARIKAVNPKVMAMHCMQHQQALASKGMEPDIHFVLNTVVTTVHFVKSRALQSHLFGQLCREMGAGHDALLYHSEVRWLSRGKVLQ